MEAGGRSCPSLGQHSVSRGLHRRGLFPALEGPRFRGTKYPRLPTPVRGLDRKLMEPWASTFASVHSVYLFVFRRGGEWPQATD